MWTKPQGVLQVHGIKIGTFQWWMKWHNDTNNTAKKPEPLKAPFVQITLRVQPGCTSTDESEIVFDLKSGMRIRLFCSSITLISFWIVMEIISIILFMGKRRGLPDAYT
jgi:hypothetical protein